MKRIFLFFLMIFSTYAAAAEKIITILQSTDLHGSPNITKFAKWIADERRKDSNLILIDCGDLCSGTFAAYYDGGASMVSYLNMCKYDIWVPGNHEFRIGNQNFRNNTEIFTSGSVLAANLKFEEADKKPKCEILPWKLIERGGIKIAVIGMASHRYDNWLSFALYRGIRLMSPADTLREIMPEIRRAKPDVILVAAHSDLGQPVETVTGNDTWIDAKSIYTQYPDIALFLAGHTHNFRSLQEYAPGQWFIQPQSNGKNMAKICIRFDTVSRKISGITAEFAEAKNLESLPVSEMPEEWRKNNDRTEIAEKTPVSVIPQSMVWNPKDGQGGIPSEMLADVIRRAAGADAAILGEVIRLTPKSSGLTERFFYGIKNTGITVLTLTPEQLKVILREQGNIQGRSAGINPHSLPSERIRVAFDDYDVTGCDGARMKLREIALSGIPQEHLDLTIRSGIRNYFLKYYPVK